MIRNNGISKIKFIADAIIIQHQLPTINYRYALLLIQIMNSIQKTDNRMQLEQYDDIYKIIVVGDASVGKTNIIYCYSKGKIPNNIMPTVGIEWASQIVPIRAQTGEEKRAKVQIWDTAGQQQYRSITMSHYRKALGAMILFDLTNPHSFSSIQYWVNLVRQRADERVQICIVGNKSDLTSKRMISRQNAQSLARKLNATYTETSIKDFQTIKGAFQNLVQNVYEVQRNRDEFGEVNQKLNVKNDSGSGCSC